MSRKGIFFPVDIFKAIKSIQSTKKNELNHTEKNLLICIAIRSGDEGFIWGSNGTIGRWINENKDYIKVILSTLKKKGYIEIKGRSRERKINLGYKLYNNKPITSYHAYLLSNQWAIIRKKILKKFDWKCAVCDSKKNLNVHHKTYKNIGNELNHLNDLIVLCESCHSVYHSKLKGGE